MTAIVDVSKGQTDLPYKGEHQRLYRHYHVSYRIINNVHA